MNRSGRTKVIATIGPASAKAKRLDALLDAGINVARVNCAHGTPESLREYIDLIRSRAARKKVSLAILADLGGPKLRIGRFENGAVDLKRGDRFILTSADVTGTRERVSVNHDLPADVCKGQHIFLNDGLISLVVTGVKKNEVRTRVEAGGQLSDLKGLSVPEATIRTPSVTEKDWRDLRLLSEVGVDYIGLSFVRTASDVRLLRQGMKRLRMNTPIVAKIEKEQAIDNLNEIVAVADAVMVARGDLGVECPIHDVAVLQKRIINTCNAAGVPVITATQMLESMTNSPRPTRAEATDVANAVLDGTDAVMLSGETATGNFPVEAVEVMRRIIASSEAYVGATPPPRCSIDGDESSGPAIGLSASMAAESVDAQAIVCLTQSGASARYVARWRPRRPILAVTPIQATWHRMNLVWGTEPVLVADFGANFDAACAHILKTLRAQKKLVTGRPVIMTAGLPFSQRGRTNTIRIATF